MELLLIIVVPLVILLAIGGILWESKTPEEKKKLEEKWERERILRQCERKAKWREFWFGDPPYPNRFPKD